jgi:anti-sigma B factor antagonist
VFTHRVPGSVDPARYCDPLMSLNVTGAYRMPVLAITGEIDMSNVAGLTELAERLLQVHPPRMVLDLAKVTFFGADGVNALLRIRRAAAVEGTQLVLRDPSRITLKVLTVTRVIDLFQLPITATTPTIRPIEHRGS